MSDTAVRTAGEFLLASLARRGTRRIFGVPGGGSSLDLIAAAPRFGLEFVLCRHEGSAAMMAVADAELTGAPGAVLTTKGPGVTNAANGIACATLERAPLLLISDGFTDAQLGYITHQVYDQCAATAPIAKGYTQALGPDPAAEIEAAIDLACAAPSGAVHLDLTGTAVRRAVSPGGARPVAMRGDALDAAALDRVRARLATARRPVLIAGLECARSAEADAVRGLLHALGCPGLVTYKAKGVIADDDPHHVGLFTGGTLEAACLDDADLILLLGVDPVELILQPWRYRAPVLELATRRFPVHYTAPAAGAYGSLPALVDAVARGAKRSDWSMDEIAAHRAGMRAGLAWPEPVGIAPPRMVTLAQERAAAVGRRPRVAVDAGAHMFSATAFWACSMPRDLLISNGLATMGFALPAAITSALHDPARGAVAFTGDGGLMMCVAELATAAETRARAITIVFNDGALSLIDIKQQQRQLQPAGVRWRRTDFARVADGFGVLGLTARTEAEYRAALDRALHHDGPSVIDVHVDPAGYGAQLQALRG